MKLWNSKPIRSIAAEDLMEIFLVSAVATILLTRAFLHFADYPRLGSSVGLHIAHMLWGGLGMLIAIAMFSSLIGRRFERSAMFIGGIGFGLFIDELGKFITRDNNYFYQPTIALVYLVFVGIYLGSRFVTKSALRPEEYAANAFDLVRDAVLGQGDEDDQTQFAALMRRAGPYKATLLPLQKLLKTAEISRRKRSVFDRIEEAVASLYRSLVVQSWFEVVVISFFVVVSFWKIVAIPRVLEGAGTVIAWLFIFTCCLIFAHDRRSRRRDVILFGLLSCATALVALHEALGVSSPQLSHFMWGEFLSTILAALIAGVGIFRLQRSRLEAYRWFKTSVLISLFLTQFFLFYRLRFFALPDLCLTLIVLGVLGYGIERERMNANGAQ